MGRRVGFYYIEILPGRGVRRCFGRVLYWWEWEKEVWEMEELHEGNWVDAGTVEGDWKCKVHYPFLDELWAAMQLAL
jgi:hypothetical protein